MEAGIVRILEPYDRLVPMLRNAGRGFGSSPCKWKCQGVADGIKLSYWSKDADEAQEAVEALQLLHSHETIQFDTKQPNFLLDVSLDLNFANLFRFSLAGYMSHAYDDTRGRG
jgi:hypothetical protein